MTLHLKFFLLLISFSCLLQARAADRKFEKQFPAKPGETLSLRTEVGDVSIISSDANEVSIVVELKGSVKDVEDFDISATENGTGVEVLGRTKSLRWWSWSLDGLNVQYRITVPKDYKVDLKTSGGDVSVQDIRGGGHAETSGGDIKLLNIEGQMDAQTSGGNVVVDHLVGNLKAGTSGGDIMITATSGDVEAESSGGNIHIATVGGRVRAETSGGDVMVSLSGPNKGIFAESSGGDIEILLGKDVGAYLEASTTGGSVICDLPVTMKGKLDDNEIRGSVNGGGELIHAETSGGDVMIKSSE